MKNKTKVILKKISLLMIVAVNLYLTRFLWREIVLSSTEKVNAETLVSTNNKINPQILAQTGQENEQKGDIIKLNQKSFNGGWLSWEDEGKKYIAISDVSAVNLLGLDLLDTENPNLQPFKWYGDNIRQNFRVQTKFESPYRYLDVTDLLTQAGLNFTIENNTLILQQNHNNIQNIVTIDQEQKQEILVTLDQPIPWQISENNQEAVIMLSANIDPYFLEKFAPISSRESNHNQPLVDDISEVDNQTLKPQLLVIEKEENQIKLRINKPENKGVKVTSLQNPYQLKIEVINDPLKPHNILWHEGIRWRKQYIGLDSSNLQNTDYFPVYWLEIDLKSPHLSLLPIHPNADSMVGAEAIVTTARKLGASVAINAGFFNRNNQYPLGAIRDNFTWLSSPILNRGAMAWNDQGNIKFDRLTLTENLLTKQGNSLPILFVNSGYVKAGIARYDAQWGSNYTPLIDNEIMIAVVNNQVVAKYEGKLANQGQFPIPNNGYLLVFRSYATGANQLAIGDNVRLESFTNPQDFERYPYVMGAGPLLIKNNQIVLNAELEGFTDAFIRQKASRSAIAMTNRGTIIIAASHNRIGGSGATLGEWAKILQRLGAVDALNLDGGSSTSLYLGGQLIDRSPVTAARVNNGLGLFINQ